MNYALVALLILCGLATVIGVMVGTRLSKRVFGKVPFSLENAVELLLQGRVEEWNEIRVLNPKWDPDLNGVDLSGARLRFANLSYCKLDESIFSNADLQGCSFRGTSLKKAVFKDALCQQALFDHADLSGAVLDGADFTGASMISARVDGTGVHRTGDTEVDPTADTEASFDEVIASPDAVQNLSPREFEQLVARLFLKTGYDVESMSSGRDGGYDLVVRHKDPFGGEYTYLVEAKKYSSDRPVGVAPVRALVGVVHAMNAHGGILITTSRFTSAAAEYAMKAGRLTLVDFQELARWVENVRDKVGSEEE
jgi:hypothetical protein